MLTKFTLASALWAGAALVLAPPAQAQTQTAPAADPETKGPEAEGAVPKANTLPLTRAVVTRAAIDAQNPDDGSDALKNVAGISSQNAKGAENGSISIRGVKLNLFSSYRLNGGLPIASIITLPAEDKERIEALKGANALMFGVASPGGLVNIVTKRAGNKDVSRAVVYGNSFGQYGTSYDFGRKFGDEKQLGIRINLSAVHAENGIVGANGRGLFGSLAGDWKATDRLSFELDFEKYTRKVNQQASITPTLVGPAVTGHYVLPRIPDPTLLATGPWNIYDAATMTFDLRSKYAISEDWKLMVEAGRSKSDRSLIQSRLSKYNVDTGAASLLMTALVGNNYVNTFARTELTGRFDTGPLKHDLTLGVSSAERYLNRASTSNTVTASQNIYNPIPVAQPVFASTPQTYLPQDPKDIGVYTYDTISVGPDWKVLAGVRRTRNIASNVNVPGGPAVITTSTVVTPAAGLLYEFAPRTTVYTSYMKGLEDGAQAPLQAVNKFQVLPSSVSTQKELGIRSSYFKAVSASLAYFDLNVASSNLDPVTNIFATDGKNRYKGVETTISADINREWSVSGAAQVLDAVQNPVFDQNAKGKRPENIPRLSANANMSYKPPLLRGLTLSAGALFIGQKYIGLYDQGTVPGYTLFNIGGNYATKFLGHRTALQISVDNLLNKAYWNSATTTALGNGMVRSVKMNAKVDL